MDDVELLSPEEREEIKQIWRESGLNATKDTTERFLARYPYEMGEKHPFSYDQELRKLYLSLPWSDAKLQTSSIP